MGSSWPRAAELKGYACGIAASPRRTGFSSIYRTQLTNFSSLMTWLSLKLRIHTSSLLFRRKEKPPLMNCMAFSSETSGAGVMQSVEMVGHDDECMQEESSLAAIVEDGSLKQFRRGRDLKEAAALRGHGGNEIRPGFLWRESHRGSINERPAAKAAPLQPAFRGLKAPAPSGGRLRSRDLSRPR